jgi:anti-sigma regulatory factor (Ser/Thr protein kinase)
VIGSADARGAYWELPARDECVGEARELACKTLADWGVQLLSDTVSLIVSELVTNAVVHARTPIRLALHGDGQKVRGQVTDRSPAWPQVGRPDDEAEGGRGLGIVAALADDWGIQPLPDGPGKTVWFECREAER